MAPILKIEQLSFHYGDNPAPVFANLDLSVEKGEFVAVVGGSGVGKSTLLKCVADLAHSSSGRITLDIPERHASRRRATVFQDGRLLPWRRLRGNIAYGLKGLNLSKTDQQARIDEVLALTRLTELADRWPHQLSGGQAQRAGIARALAVHPDLLLMDEPFSAVDAITRQHLQDELLNIWQKTGAAVLFITHDIEEAVYLADRVVVLSGSPARVQLDQPVELARPRGRNAEDLQQLAHAIAQEL
ncbi:ABC transporter ATP-binding protein [Marinobacterium weihaiense]|uniref:ABC transporter ATP-binding protein n=1 Tax=Marinobacterium weihaiense TaxID=2851016 RepID=A0ABS6M6G1_9GAMM|nr:ABC transporter ATP-binding protein [Marinobacterium weihaiense]MBV0931873.1 ABC transporter ATP-binding protein [Marinobacterium weihaiense]